jgi:hypothetical protein
VLLLLLRSSSNKSIPTASWAEQQQHISCSTSTLSTCHILKMASILNDGMDVTVGQIVQLIAVAALILF